MINELLECLGNEWVTQPLRKPLSAIKAAGSTGQARKINFLVFENQAALPSYLMKLVRDWTQQSRLTDEFNKLEFLNSFALLQPFIPRTIGLFKHRDNLVMVEESIPGVSLENFLLRGKHHSQMDVSVDMTNVQNWLIAFQDQTREGTKKFRGSVEIQERMDGLSKSLPASLANQLCSMADEASGLSIPLTARHGDFWPGNVLISQFGIGIIDWETLELSSWPFDDLFFFTVTYALRHQEVTQPTKSQAAHFEWAFLRENKFSLELSGLVKQVIQSLGINPKFASLFFVLFLLDMASSKTKLGRTGESGPMWHEFLQQIHSLDELVLSR